MTTFLYFAYGSNMLTERLQRRCRSARPVGTAIAKNYRVRFSKRSDDASGKATLLQDHGSATYGVLFEISNSELGDLDRAEGNGYERIDKFEVLRNSERVKACTYRAASSEVDKTLIPYDWYHALVVAGAFQHGLPDSYVDMLCNTACLPDANACRPGRLVALHVLERTGFAFLVSEG